MKKLEIKKTKKLIFTSKANFKDIREQGGFYVDKTKQIYDCIGKDPYYFIARPRRFGKSTLCRTLEQLFLGNRYLFKGLWIDTSDWGWKKHPVIYLDMSDVAGKTSTAASVQEKLLTQLLEIAEDYQVTLRKSKSTDTVFGLLIKALYKKFNIGVVVIIDEYDKPILDLIVADKPYEEVHGIISDLYAKLKPAEEYLRFAFLTGVFKFTKTSIFSSLNNLNDLTFASHAGDLVGYTQEELESNFDEEIDLLATEEKLTRSAMLEKLRIEYNGYCFGFNPSTEKLSPSVYNPFAINHSFAANQMLQKWFASGSPSFLIQKIKEGKFEVMEPEGFLVDFSKLSNSCNPDAITALPLLYYAGYATIAEYTKDSNEIRLIYPNAEVARATANELVALFQNQQSSILFKLAWEIGKLFRTNDLAQLEELLEMAFAQLTYKIFVSQEKYFQSMIMLILIMGKLRVEAEVPTALGRADLIVYLPDRIFIIETKFNKPAGEGLDQIKDHRYMVKFLAMGLPIEAVGISIAIKKPKAKTAKGKKITKTRKAKLCRVAYENIFSGKRLVTKKKLAVTKKNVAKKTKNT